MTGKTGESVDGVLMQCALYISSRWLSERIIPSSLHALLLTSDPADAKYGSALAAPIWLKNADSGDTQDCDTMTYDPCQLSNDF